MHSKSNPEASQQRNLFIFDFDKTIIESDSYVTGFIDILNFQDEMSKLMMNCESPSHLNKSTNALIKASGIDFDNNKSRLDSIQILPGAKELFDYLLNFKHNSDFIIISGSISVFVEYYLRKHQIEIFDHIFAHESYVNDQNFVCFPEEQEPDNAKNVCRRCYSVMCKAKILERFEKSKVENHNVHYNRKYYFGDGLNDICGALHLQSSDYLFPRIDFPLHKRLRSLWLRTENILPWNDGFEIINFLINTPFETYTELSKP